MPSEKENKAEKCLRLVSAQTYFTIPLSLSPTLPMGLSEWTICTYNVCAEYVRHTRSISSYVWMKTNAPRRWETKQKSQWWQQNERALRSALQQQRSTAEANANDNSDSGLFLFNDLFLGFPLLPFISIKCFTEWLKSNEWMDEWMNVIGFFFCICNKNNHNKIQRNCKEIVKRFANSLRNSEIINFAQKPKENFCKKWAFKEYSNNSQILEERIYYL